MIHESELYFFMYTYSSEKKLLLSQIAADRIKYICIDKILHCKVRIESNLTSIYMSIIQILFYEPIKLF
jgi:hypothetical protein